MTSTSAAASAAASTPTRGVPYKQIRARQPTGATLVVYQAYAAAIAGPAARTQRLDASPAFQAGRMTWVKPSFLWCMYRSGWSHKDANQARVLAIEMRVEGLRALVAGAVGAMARDRPAGGTVDGEDNENGAGDGDGAAPETETDTGTGREKGKVQVRFQWDPERDVRLERLPYRSLQLGIAGGMVRRWIDEWIVRIEDITDDVRRFHALIENEGRQGVDKVVEELKGDKWREDVLHLGEELEMALGMPGDDVA